MSVHFSCDFYHNTQDIVNLLRHQMLRQGELCCLYIKFETKSVYAMYRPPRISTRSQIGIAIKTFTSFSPTFSRDGWDIDESVFVFMLIMLAIFFVYTCMYKVADYYLCLFANMNPLFMCTSICDQPNVNKPRSPQDLVPLYVQ